ncbi:amidohydrolase [Marivirga sp. S37H4]|uniref:Amidohydrolase n=1 Tax=Marivirga aurantiaca TaxID=2802615 RepID=A0A935CDD6_9BACT|nr:amidohydrolase [Marivirga aurantiaca]MBK6266803.1 amidohydrolase [Marivirga aurantiaca]
MPFSPDLDELKTLRQELHQNAELSNHEKKTAEIIKHYLSKYDPDEIIENIGGYGLVAIFKGKKKGKNIGIRADMDALPIAEHLELTYSSTTENVAHKCGHDGHMTMVSGLAAYLHANKQEFGDVHLLYQPAEETGEGAERISKGLTEKNIQLDYLFGLHNLPGFAKGEIVSKKGTFAAASKGMVIKLTGDTSHAAEPENGRSPVLAISRIIAEMTDAHKNHSFSALTLATVIHVQMGEIAFGTTPGYGEVRITLRAMEDNDMNQLTHIAENLVKESAEEYGLDHDISYIESFPATENSEALFETIKEVALSKDMTFNEIEKPFKWSEDFGHFKKITQTGFFGLGAGESTPGLHNKEYDFPDDITENGLQMYIGLIEHLAKNV